MNGYILNREGIRKETEKKLYRTGELELMTTHQLREICRREKIIQGMLNPLDKEELVSVIMRYRGTREQLLIRKESDAGTRVLEQLFAERRIVPVQDRMMHIPSKLIVYEGLSMSADDRVRIPYRSELENTNALLVSGGKEICGIFHLQGYAGDKEHLYVVKEEGMPCREADLKEYDLYCFRQQDSDRIFALYYGTNGDMPERLSACRIPLMDVEVRSPVELRMPLVIDFGSSSTAAGICLDSQYFEETRGVPFAENMKKDTIQHVTFAGGSRLMPSVAGVSVVRDGKPRLVFGQEAVDLAGASYVDEGFSVFYDMKRWISDPDREEEITDREGRRTFLARKEIIRAFFHHVIRAAENQFKCRVRQIHVTCPVRQKFLFQKLFYSILPEYMPQDGEMLDEGAAVLYNTISGMLESGKLEEDTEYQALVIDCGGGTTDLCACRFRYHDDRVAYHIRIGTAYENGDTDFGGDNLTCRIMQYIKIRMVEKLGFRLPVSAEDILQGLDVDTFRFVDANGTSELYKSFEDAYEMAGQYLPTKFKEYETRSRDAYFRVKNNFYHLFYIAEQVKKYFYERAGVLR
ncbi:MAG: molecular chaperone, partial [Lachnospiraceae bacterium]|nr:molecular chaperone [Lachnospiraceae bacterium]